MNHPENAYDNVQRALSEVDHPHEEHEEHPDERWLVSYADMMTLLFGLFVLLFSMATLKKEQAEAINRSTESKFSGEKTPTPVVEKDLIAEMADLKTNLAASQAEVEKLKVAQAEIEKVAAERIMQLEREKRSSQDLGAQLQSTQKSVADQSQKNERRIAELEKLNESTEALRKKSEAEKAELVARLTELQAKAEASKEERKRDVAVAKTTDLLEKKLAEAESAREVLQQEKRALEERLQNQPANGSMQQQSFLAFFINWSTKDHDIDMTIQDPNVKSFDFKKRKYPGQPGLFALDTRRGPGAELWQSDQLIPGTYKATYLFYNTYGNQQPAVVTGTIFTPKGSTEVPPLELKFDTRRSATVEFDVDKDGKVSMRRP